MSRSKKDKSTNTAKVRPPLKIDTIAPSILKEGMPTKPPLKAEVVVAPSILKEGVPTRPPLPNAPTPAPSILKEGPTKAPIPG